MKQNTYYLQSKKLLWYTKYLFKTPPHFSVELNNFRHDIKNFAEGHIGLLLQIDVRVTNAFLPSF